MVTKKEVAKMIKKIAVLFPNYFKSDMKETIEAWYELFADEKNDQMFKNLNAVLKEKRYPPVPADIISYQWPIELKHVGDGGFQL